MDVVTIIALSASALAAFSACISAAVAVAVYRSQNTPNVIAYVAEKHDDPDIAILYVENIGKAPAYDVRLLFEDNPPVNLPSFLTTVCLFMDNGIPFLPPGGKRSTPLGTFVEFCDSMSYKTAAMNVSWSIRSNGKRITASYPFEAYSFHGITGIDIALKKQAET